MQGASGYVCTIVFGTLASDLVRRPAWMYRLDKEATQHHGRHEQGLQWAVQCRGDVHDPAVFDRPRARRGGGTKYS